MPEDQIEMLWRCGDKGCNNENRGRHKKCERCGRPKTEKDGYYMPGDISHEAAVTDEKELQRAKGGEDWGCRYCGTCQFRADGLCSNCGVRMETGEQSFLKPPASWIEPPIRRVSRLSFLRRIFNRYQPIFIIGWLLVAVIIFLLWAMEPRLEVVTVVSTSWSTRVHVELYSKHYHDGFYPDINAVDLESRGMHVHHYDHVLTGHHSEPYNHHYSCGQVCRDVPKVCSITPRSCRNNKNGYASCTGGDRICTGGGRSCDTKYCDETLYKPVDDYTDIPQYAPFFSWNHWEWAFEKDLPLSGTDLTPVYADLPPSEVERKSGQELKLDVVFTNGKESWTYHPNLAEFPQYTVGTHRKIRVGLLGDVTVL